MPHRELGRGIYSIFDSPIIHSFCFPRQILKKLLFSNAPGRIALSQEYLKTITPAKLRGKTECFTNVTSLKPEQTQAVEPLLAGKDVLPILPTGFGKSLIYQVFSMAQTSANVSVLVISPLNSIVEEQAKEMNGLGIPSVHLKPDIEDCLHDISD